MLFDLNENKISGQLDVVFKEETFHFRSTNTQERHFPLIPDTSVVHEADPVAMTDIESSTELSIPIPNMVVPSKLTAKESTAEH